MTVLESFRRELGKIWDSIPLESQARIMRVATNAQVVINDFPNVDTERKRGYRRHLDAQADDVKAILASYTAQAAATWWAAIRSAAGEVIFNSIMSAL